MVVWKNASEASPKAGEFVRFTTTSVPLSASGKPCPLSRPTPEDGECGTASCLLAFRILTTCDPMSPVPPMTAIRLDPVQVFDLPWLAGAARGHWCLP
jgi:hypothetical protein